MMGTYVADAHAFSRYLTDNLPKRADRIFKDVEEGKSKLFMPSIAIAELIYVFEKTLTEAMIREMFEKIDSYPTFSIHPLDSALLKILPEIKLREIHDRIIVGTCKQLNADGLLSKDKEIRGSGLVKAIW